MLHTPVLLRAGVLLAALLGRAQALPSPDIHTRQTTAEPGLANCNNATFAAVIARFGGAMAPSSPYNSTNEPYTGTQAVLAFAPAIGIPDICGVRILATNNIAFEMYLPSPARWNRRFLTVGNGGFAGGTSRVDLFSRAVHGWAVMSTNTGHEDPRQDLGWGENNTPLQIDWAWRAMNTSVPYAKAIVAAYYQAASPDLTTRKNYYSGCSTGGRQGIRQVEVDSASFDGMLVGAPAWNVRSAMPVLSRVGWLSHTYGLEILPSQASDLGVIGTIYRRINQTCNVIGFDTTDADGVIQDTAACLRRFQESGTTGDVWSGLDCPDNNTTPAPNCVTLSQREAFMALLQEFKVPPANQTYAGDGFDISAIKDASNFLFNTTNRDFDQQFARYFLGTPIVWDSDANGAELLRLSNEWDATVRANADPRVLRADGAWGGKTILYTGTADGTVARNGTRRAFDLAGGAANANLKFFELPGMPHCVDSGTGGDNPPWYIGGVGLNIKSPFNIYYMPNNTVPPLNNPQSDALLALVDWVEGPAGTTGPTQLIATAFGNWGTDYSISKQRPICAAPNRLQYVSGDANAKESWTCVPA